MFMSRLCTPYKHILREIHTHAGTRHTHTHTHKSDTRKKQHSSAKCPSFVVSLPLRPRGHQGRGTERVWELEAGWGVWGRVGEGLLSSRYGMPIRLLNSRQLRVPARDRSLSTFRQKWRGVHMALPIPSIKIYGHLGVAGRERHFL